ncbi:MAG: hypothetical protein AAB944_01080 [Patescibacteria group bacterium]
MALPQSGNNRAIIWASYFGDIEIVRLLLTDSRVDPAANNSAAIKNARYWGYTEIVSLLLADSRVDLLSLSDQLIKEEGRIIVNRAGE